MSGKHRAIAAISAACGLLLTAPTAAHAEVEPGGWTSESPGFKLTPRTASPISITRKPSWIPSSAVCLTQ